jgi:hypothetical protein
MAPLPRSKHHRFNVPALVNDTVPTSPPAALAQPAPVTHENEDFTHPNHVVPPPTYAGIDTLVIVCCHAIYHPDASSPSFPLKSPLDEKHWHLAPFQRSNTATGKPGEHETFVAHVLAGLTVASQVDNSLLVFSGGATKTSLTSKTESQSYLDAALAHELAEGHRDGGRVQKLLSKGRLLLEEHATDSLQNLLLSVVLFRQTTGKYPKHIRVITHAFKAKRFLYLHAPAIQWPSDRIQVQGINPVMSKEELDGTSQGEETHGYAPWMQDPLGTGEALSLKRRQRGWDDAVALRLAEDLEESVRELVTGHVSDGLPWSAE